MLPADSLNSNARLRSLDVYRGFVMLLMMAEVLSFARVDHAIPGTFFWHFLNFNQSHVDWAGASLHDMIQPSFTFLVGAAMPFSIAARVKKGAAFSSLLWHVLYRSLILVLLGIFLRSMHSEITYFTFEDTLTQIGLGYTFLFLIARLKWRLQVISLCVILFGYWLAFVVYPLPGPGFDYELAGVAADWEHNFTGLAAHWNKNTNLAWAFDRWFLNLFKRTSVFTHNAGGYATLSFIPTLGTMIFGLLAGNLLMNDQSPAKKIRVFLIASALLVPFAIILHFAGISPIVKRIWTPGWTIFSAGICLLFLSFFYFTNDVIKQWRIFFPLMVIGMNSIAAYVMAETLAGFFKQSLFIHLGANYVNVFGTPYATLVSGAMVLLIEWLILYWMHRRRIFIKV